MAKKNNNIVLVIDEKRAMLAKAIDASTKTSKEVASILADIDATKAYMDIKGVDSLKAWFDMNHDNIEGIGYKQAKQLIDIHNYVWNHNELADIPSGVASALVSACKKDADKVIALVKAKKITRNTPQKTVRELLVKEGLRKGNITTSKEKTNNEDFMFVDALFARIEAILKNEHKTVQLDIEICENALASWHNMKEDFNK